ncbi:MAG: phosphatidylglycerol lysyltransferase [Treponema sp.]|jgi:phosphoglucomutase|nr:phosphatidylglycerol lysyltransferase [Treponema sp.]
MICADELNSALDKMILSASGWRAVFAADGGEESSSCDISAANRIICGAAAFVFADFLKLKSCGQNPQNKPLVLLGADTRPTGKSIAEAIMPVLIAQGCDVQYAGIIAAPEIMAWARNRPGAGNQTADTGFIYISASHNPIGHNGLKFGLTDGGVLPAKDAVELIANFRAFLGNNDCICKIDSIFSAANRDTGLYSSLLNNTENSKKAAFKAYYDFCGETVYGGQQKGEPSVAAALKDGLEKMPLGVVCDFNGSARTVSIDREFLSAAGLKFECINDKPGQIVHRIVPEGESLLPCAGLLEEVHNRNASFMLGYVPDCDGDRGNLVIWDTQTGSSRHMESDSSGKTRVLEAQEVFALACAAELSHLAWMENSDSASLPRKTAVAVNDPTSMRIDRIAQAFGASVFRAEVGEANVVSLARRLRTEGYTVRILGEGSAGGNITHPSAVRDPINTVMAIVKLLSIRSSGRPGLFEIWCRRSGQMDKYRGNFTLADIISSLPQFVTTPAYNKDAVLRINAKDHAILKDRYGEIFLREWEKRKNELKSNFGFFGWEAVAYNGLEEKRNLVRFEEAGRGGLKIIFFDSKRNETAYIWMRGSATEPVFRIMADVQGSDNRIERYLLDWQRDMIMESDQ